MSSQPENGQLLQPAEAVGMSAMLGDVSNRLNDLWVKAMVTVRMD